MLLTEPLLSCPGCVFRVVVMLEDPATTHLQWGKDIVGQDLAIHGPIHPPLNTVQSSCPLCRKASPKKDVSTSMLHGWDGIVGVVLILLFSPNTVEWSLDQKALFCLIRPHDLLPSSRWSLANVRRALTCAGLSRGTLRALQDFNP